MRGEYKVPGGKLVAVDVEVEAGRLARVSISGDFFLEPDDALERIDRALTGLPENSSVAQLTDAITAVLDDSIAMIGFSPEAIGIAV
ncbi:MAG TPA: lipoate--protein ligase family protein, partial [Actinomycetales bacterium]|nr:lipoate--protein ligase family protein [Actinomycetales bacterium]